MKLNKPTKEALFAAGAGIVIVAWIGLLSNFIIPRLIKFDMFGNQTYTTLGFFIFGCIITPLWEELLYRYVPFELMKKVNIFTRQDFSILTLVFTSIIFALAHTNNGILAIVYQGVGGFILGVIYLKSKRSYLCSVITHAVWNFTIFFVVPFLS